MARNGTKRVSYTSIPIFNDAPLQIAKDGTLYGITNEGRLWRGTLDGNATQLPLSNLNPNSKFLMIDNSLVFSNDKSVFVMNEKFEYLHNFDVANNIVEISNFNGNLIVKTNEAIYVWKNGEIKEGMPIETDGFTAVNDLDKDGKLNLIISRDNFLYNFEIE